MNSFTLVASWGIIYATWIKIGTIGEAYIPLSPAPKLPEHK